jgi:hypothetical protein
MHRAAVDFDRERPKRPDTDYIKRLFSADIAARDLAREMRHSGASPSSRSFLMVRAPSKAICKAAQSLGLSLLIMTGLAFGQGAPDDQPAPEAPPQQQEPAPRPGWRHFSNPPQDQPAAQTQGPPPDQPDQNASENQGLPPELTLKPGTFVTVRLNQFLSSDRNEAGDAFSATLAQPLVVNGIVVAERGQTVGGRVVQAEKAGRVKGVSRLALELTGLTLVDGRPVTIRTEFVGQKGPTSNGRDAAAVATTTGLGAAIGAAADWGTGAAIGAGAGAAAGVLGVLLTRGQPTVIPPESLLTFRIETPVTISTTRAPQAFRYVEAGDYQQPERAQGPPPPPPPPPAPNYYWGPPYPYYWGPGFAFWYRPRFYYGHGFHYHH